MKKVVAILIVLFANNVNSAEMQLPFFGCKTIEETLDVLGSMNENEKKGMEIMTKMIRSERCIMLAEGDKVRVYKRNATMGDKKKFEAFLKVKEAIDEWGVWVPEFAVKP